MALYFYFNETTGDLVYSDKATYSADSYTSLGEQTNMNPDLSSDWVFDSHRSTIVTVSKDESTIEKIAGLTSMEYMFYGCGSLTSLDLSGFDTSAVTDISEMFCSCNHLTSIDLSSFDTSAVTIMGAVFSNCSILTSLDLSGFDTSAVTNMSSMFNGCNKLINLDISGFDTSAVTNMSSMFSGCSSLINLDISGFDTSAVTYMSNMFRNCGSLTSFDLSSFDTSAATYITNIFINCSGLRLITISDKMSNVLSQLPATQYYPAAGGEPVARESLTEGTWVRDEADLSMVTSIVEQAQMSQAINRRIGKICRDLRTITNIVNPSVDIVRTTTHSTSYTKDTLEIVTDTSGKVTEMWFVTAD